MSAEFRSGIGYDLHRLVPGRKLILGGVEIPFDKGPEGHSDGDVILHALTDALLGAAALGDIGEHFPPSDPRWKDADSAQFVRRARELIEGAGYRTVNIDVVVVLERPKLLAHRQTIRQNLSAMLGLPLDAVSVKAKTSEGVGPIGRGEAVEAHAAVLLARLGG
jgi:2-C-methyl-D-erythritol 2,4-cyclodiphosphate synthase